MARNVLYDQSTPLHYVDSAGRVPTAASVVFVGADGAERALTSAVTLPTDTATVTAATPTAITVSGTPPFAAGDLVGVDAGGRRQIAAIARIDGSVLHLSTALDAAPAASSVVRALRMTATLSAPGAALLGGNHRLVWDLTVSGEAVRYVDAPVAVCRYVPAPPMSTAEVRDQIYALAASHPKARDFVYCRSIADRVAARVEQELQSGGRRSSLLGDPNAFREVGRLLARQMLAEDGIIPPGATVEGLMRELQFQVSAAMRTAVSGLTYDAGETGVQTQAPQFWSFRPSL